MNSKLFFVLATFFLSSPALAASPGIGGTPIKDNCIKKYPKDFFGLMRQAYDYEETLSKLASQAQLNTKNAQSLGQPSKESAGSSQRESYCQAAGKAFEGIQKNMTQAREVYSKAEKALTTLQNGNPGPCEYALREAANYKTLFYGVGDPLCAACPSLGRIVATDACNSATGFKR